MVVKVIDPEYIAPAKNTPARNDSLQTTKQSNPSFADFMDQNKLLAAGAIGFAVGVAITRRDRNEEEADE